MYCDLTRYRFIMGIFLKKILRLTNEKLEFCITNELTFGVFRSSGRLF